MNLNFWDNVGNGFTEGAKALMPLGIVAVIGVSAVAIAHAIWGSNEEK